MDVNEFVADKPIYIVLTDTGTWLARLIRLYTKAPLNHASIAFDPGLTEVYSFGRKRPANPFVGGFVREDFGGELFRDAPCAIYKCVVSEKQYHHIRDSIRRFEKEAHRYKYNFLGLFGVLFKIQIRRNYAFFCSQFVAFLFEQAGLRLVPKSPSMTTPSDFSTAESLELVYTGKLRDFIAARSEGQIEVYPLMVGNMRSSM